MNVKSPALEQLRKIQKSLYDMAHADARAIVSASTSRAILAYSEKFERSLPDRFRRSSLNEIYESIRQNRIVLYGDFHTFRQSQRGLLRLMRGYAERQKTRKIAIALEMFKAIDQDNIDAYLAGAVSEQDFLTSINYEVEWGFPWQNFKMILDFARQQKIPVFGINSDNGGRDKLSVRDAFAAQKLLEAADKYRDYKIFALIGEYHLADSHLPKCIAEESLRRVPKVGLIRVLNNVDRYYFGLQTESPASPNVYIRLRKDFFCVMNSPPWMKWQSFSIWEDLKNSGLPSFADQEGEIDQDFDLHTEDSFDIDFHFLTFVKNIASFLDIKIDDSEIETFHIYFSPDGDFIREIGRDSDIEPAEAGRIVERATNDGVHFLPKSNTVLLTYMSINNLAEAAGQYLHNVLSGMPDKFSSVQDDFCRRVLHAAVGMIASKILNPRRKCMEIHHWRQFQRRHKGQRLTGNAARRRIVANGVLAYEKWFRDRRDGKIECSVFATIPRGILIRDRQLNYEISREIGQILGFNFYKKVLANKIPHHRISRLFKKKISSPNFMRNEVLTLHELLA